MSGQIRTAAAEPDAGYTKYAVRCAVRRLDLDLPLRHRLSIGDAGQHHGNAGPEQHAELPAGDQPPGLVLRHTLCKVIFIAHVSSSSSERIPVVLGARTYIRTCPERWRPQPGDDVGSLFPTADASEAAGACVCPRARRDRRFLRPATLLFGGYDLIVILIAVSAVLAGLPGGIEAIR